MHFKGHNGKTSCRWCTIEGIPYITNPQSEGNEGDAQEMDDPDEHARTDGPFDNSTERADDAAPQPVPKKKKKPKTTYYIARKPQDLPEKLQQHGIVDMDYKNLPRRTDESVKNDVNRIIEVGITAKERDRRKMKAGINGPVCAKQCATEDGSR